MFLAKVYVTYKESILDPQGEAIKAALHRLDFQNVADVTQGKYFELRLAGDKKVVQKQVEKICDRLLANVNMETYRYELSPVED